MNKACNKGLLNNTRVSSSLRSSSLIAWAKTVFAVSVFSSSLYAESTQIKNLREDSPFLPPGYNDVEAPVTKPPVKNGPLSREIDFRGYAKIDGVYRFNFFLKNDQKSYWIKEGEKHPQSGIQVNGFEIEDKSITLSMNGRNEKLSMIASSTNSVPVNTIAPATLNTARPIAQDASLNTPANDIPQRRKVPRRRVVLPRR